MADAVIEEQPEACNCVAATMASSKKFEEEAQSSSSSSSSSTLTMDNNDTGRTTTTLRKRSSTRIVDGLNSVDSRSLLDESMPAAPAKEEIVVTEKVTSRIVPSYNQRPSAPAHRRIKESPLSSDAIFHQSHAGLFNLCIVVLVAVNSRLIIENLMKYGLLINSGFWFSSKSARDWPLLMCGLSLPIFPLAALLVEKLKVQTNVSEAVIFVLHLIISTLGILYPGYVIHRVQSALLPGLILILIALTWWMKLVSYAHTNKDVREILKAGGKPEVPQHAENVDYPDNLTVQNIAYFMLAPTLCYQLSYPRSGPVRKGWVVRQVGKLIVFVGLMGFIIEQYINPTVLNSQHPLKGNPLNAVERILKLSMPVLYVWLCIFYCLFHLWLNIVAELLRFGDREFYKDWWNAQTVEEGTMFKSFLTDSMFSWIIYGATSTLFQYWRMWNMPVHKWMVRHIYFPSIRAGLPKVVAMILVFVISALFHEVAIGVPCHMLRCWAFLGILLQLPLVYLTNVMQKRFQNSMVGNMVFWFFFCIVGQPMCLLLYYHDVANSFPRT